MTWERSLGAHPGGLVLRPGDALGQRHFWNGNVVITSGRFVLHYTAQVLLGVAIAPSPSGPFTNANKWPLRSDVKEIYIDLFIDDDGRRYFYFARFDKGNVIHVAHMNHELMGVDERKFTEVLRANSHVAPSERTDKKAGGFCQNRRFSDLWRKASDGWLSR